MPDILHRVGVRAPLDDVYAALSTPGGLAGWWTRDSRGESRVGERIEFRFPQHEAQFDMEVVELLPAGRVAWKVVAGPEEWIGTRIGYELKREGDFTVVLFRHEGWREPVEFMHHCSTKWAVFLLSLKALVETGKGAPYPDDIKIDDWN